MYGWQCSRRRVLHTSQAPALSRPGPDPPCQMGWMQVPPAAEPANSVIRVVDYSKHPAHGLLLSTRTLWLIDGFWSSPWWVRWLAAVTGG